MNNQENKNVNDSNYIDSKTGSGYVSAGNNNMDFSVALVIGFLVITILGGMIFLFTNDDIKDLFSLEDIVETFEDLFEEDYYDYDYTYDTQYSVSEFKEINARNIEIESRDNIIVLWIGRQTCGYCKLYAPVIEEVVDEFDMEAYYIDLGKIIDFETSSPYITDQTAYDIISNLNGSGEWYGFAAQNINGTPLTLIIKDNEVIGGVAGFVSEGNLTGIFFDAGLTK